MALRIMIVAIAMLCVCVACASDADTGPTAPYAFEVETVGPFTNGVHGMAFASDGTLYYSDTYRNADDKSLVHTLRPPYDGPSAATGIAGANVSGLLFHDDALYVCATGENRIRRYGPDHELEGKWVVPAPWNVAVVGDRLLAVTYDGRVFVLAEDGKSAPVLDGLASPFDLATAGEGAFHVSEQMDAPDEGRVRSFDPQGREIARLDHAFANPEGLALDDRGWLYIADTGAGRLLRASPDGRVELVTDAYELPIVVARGPDGHIYFNTAGAEPRLVRVRLVEAER